MNESEREEWRRRMWAIVAAKAASENQSDAAFEREWRDFDKGWDCF